jgi:hypothetical protein
VLLRMIDGSTSPKEVAEIQKDHQDEETRPVITCVTNAGMYGISLPADQSIRMPTWNHARGKQQTGRFFRNPFQPHISQVCVPHGITEYMRDLEGTKQEIADNATNALLHMDDEETEPSLKDESALKTLMQKLNYYRPKIRDSEGA